MDFDSLFDRAPVAELPLSVVIRLEAAPLSDEVLERVQGLLVERRRRQRCRRSQALESEPPRWPREANGRPRRVPAPPWSGRDEIVLLAQGPLRRRLPRRRDGVRLRWLAVENAASGAGLRAALDACANPIAVLVDAEASLTEDEFDAMVAALDHCDLVVGQRGERWRWLRRPLETVCRWIFGVPVTDPLCPIKGLRLPAAKHLVLETEASLVDFELIAKMTFLTSLMDEVPLMGGGCRPAFWRQLRASRTLLRVLCCPRFWGDEAGTSFRPPLGAPLALAGAAVDPGPAPWRHGARARPGGWGPAFPRAALGVARRRLV